MVEWESAPVGEPIVIRGFLAKDQNGSIYLTSEPNVPTCCAGKNKKSEILIEGWRNMELPQHVVSLKGEIRKEGKTLSLSHAQWESEASTFSYAEMALFAVPFILVWGWKKLFASSR